MTHPSDENARLKQKLDASTALNKGLLAHVETLTGQLNRATEQVEELATRVEELTRELSKNSSNSHKPPSSDILGKRRSFRLNFPPESRRITSRTLWN